MTIETTEKEVVLTKDLEDYLDIQNLNTNQIDYLIAKHAKIGLKTIFDKTDKCVYIELMIDKLQSKYFLFSPTRYWIQGGPLLQKHGISINLDFKNEHFEWWCGYFSEIRDENTTMYGETQLEAGMKAILRLINGQQEKILVPKGLI